MRDLRCGAAKRLTFKGGWRWPPSFFRAAGALRSVWEGPRRAQTRSSLGLNSFLGARSQNWRAFPQFKVKCFAALSGASQASRKLERVCDLLAGSSERDNAGLEHSSCRRLPDCFQRVNSRAARRKTRRVRPVNPRFPIGLGVKWCISITRTFHEGASR